MSEQVQENPTLSRQIEGWQMVSISQRSPDNTRTVGWIHFLVCPECASMVPIDDHDETRYKYQHRHHDDHQKRARWEKGVDEDIDNLEDRLNDLENTDSEGPSTSDITDRLSALETRIDDLEADRD